MKKIKIKIKELVQVEKELEFEAIVFDNSFIDLKAGYQYNLENKEDKLVDFLTLKETFIVKDSLKEISNKVIDTEILLEGKVIKIEILEN